MRRILVLIAILALMPIGSAQAHPGRTDANGGHNCRVGACAGTYHYHNGGGSSSTPQPSTYTKPRTPIVHTETITREEAVDFKKTTQFDYREYSDFIHKLNDGQNGKRLITTEITYTDGKETGRSDIKNEITLHSQRMKLQCKAAEACRMQGSME